MPTPTLKTLVTFNGTNGFESASGLIADAAGDLFGTTTGGGPGEEGNVFEIANSGGGNYAGTPTSPIIFNGPNGQDPQDGLIADASGDLFGTTYEGGTSWTSLGSPGYGTVFELVNNGTLKTLVNFNLTNGTGPIGGLFVDAAGNLLGTTTGINPNTGLPANDGTVFEIAKSGGTYASTPTTLFTFNGTDGKDPETSLIVADAAGDLFGTTNLGGANGDGEVFEIKNNGTTASPNYANAPTVLASFNGTNGANPLLGSLTADATGDLFGTTNFGGVGSTGPFTGNGTVFELVNNGGGSYTLKTLVSFNGTNGNGPEGGLILDAAGDLFGTTAFGGPDGGGNVFEIAKSGGSYASTPTILWNFTGGTDDNGPVGNLIADASGDLFGTNSGEGFVGNGPDAGSVWELTNTGFQVPQPETVTLTAPMGTLGSSAAAAAKFVVTGNLDASYTGSLTLTDGTFSTALAYTGNGTYSPNLDTWADGTVSAALAVSDPAGNSFSVSTTVAIDPDFGETASVSGPAGTLGSVGATAVAFTVTTPDGNETGLLTLTDGTFHTTLAVTGNGTYTANLDTWADGTVTASLAVSDPAGNSFTTSTSATIDPDFGETASVNGPAGRWGRWARPRWRLRSLRRTVTRPVR